MAVIKSASRYRWVILALAFVSQWSNALSSQAIPPLAPLFQQELGLTKAQVGLFSSAVFLGAWFVLIMAGTLTDRLGVRRVMSAGQLLTGTLLVLMAAVGSFFQALAVMFAAGVGRGFAAPGVSKAVIDWFPPAGRATAMGIKQSAMPVAGIMTASILPALALAVGWRAAMAVAGLGIFAGGLLTLALYRDASRSGQALPARQDMRAGLRHVMRNPRLWALSIAALFFAAAQTSMTTYFVLYFKESVLVSAVTDEHTRIVAAGGYLAMCQLGGAFARIAWGLASDRLFGGRRSVVLAIVGFLSAGVSLLVGNLEPSYPLWLLSAIAFAYGATGIAWGGLYLAAAVEMAGRRYAGTGIGWSMTLMQAGNVGGAPLYGFIVDVTGSYGLGWLYVGCLYAAGAFLAAVTARSEVGNGIGSKAGI